MESGAAAATVAAVTTTAASSSATPVDTSNAFYAETMWPHMGMRFSASVESGTYPERPGEPDCSYYLRTGLCRFGMACRFNHPPDRNLAIATARMKGEFPERVGQPECQYYLKTGSCNFGPTCKFHHPKDKAGILGRAQLNSLGYPLRPNEKECAYYLKNAQCKFGITCKFHHPEYFQSAASARSSVYPSVNSPTNSGSQSYPVYTSWAMPRASFIPSPRWQGPTSYAQVILPQGLVQIPSWPGQLLSATSSESRQQSPGRQDEASASAQGLRSPYRSAQYDLPIENIFPERPDQPECQYYMKTGDCKYGAVCKFHHPRERSIPAPNCVLSPLGLPLRPGEPICKFYSRYGICKFGPNCKFDHPMATSMGVYAYGLSTSPVSSNVPVVRHLLDSSPGTMLVSSVPWRTASRDVHDGSPASSSTVNVPAFS